MDVIIAAAAFSSFFATVEGISRHSGISKELSRKLVHILSALGVAVLPFVMSFSHIAYLALLFIPVMLLSKRLNFFSSIHQVKRFTLGEVYFPIAILIMAVVFPQRLIFIYGMLIMGLSDGLASLIGQKYGKQKYTLMTAEKSYIGSFTFFVTAAFIGLAITLSNGAMIGWSALIALPLAAVLTITEAGLSSGLDNLALPLIAAGLLLGALRLIP